MVNILEQIVANKRIEVTAMQRQRPLTAFIDKLQPSNRDLYAAIKEQSTAFILECKKASPSKGLIRDNFDLEYIASVYQQYAAAISVLTDAKYFQGDHKYLRYVRDQVTCPVLNKDFFIDEYQVHLARYYGADAVLLMLSVLDDKQYQQLANVAKRYNMAILTEVSNQQETIRAINLGAKLIGINNRNLRDLTTNLDTTQKLAKLIPNDRLVISESGIYTNKQVRQLAPLVNGFLVGSSLMAQGDIDLACRKLVFGLHKICGLTRSDDVICAIEHGAVYCGLIFTQQSPRYISPEQAMLIQQQVAKRLSQHVDYVGVFKNQQINEVAAIANLLNLSVVQLHGDEDSDYIHELKQRLHNHIYVSKAIGIDAHLTAVPDGADVYLFDSPQGGSGISFDWQQLANYADINTITMLAGGLNPDNLVQAIATAQQYHMQGLDLNSGVEVSPGIKDASKIKQAFSLIRQY
ncbi:bifunctional indole-3-glycerol-phosphate synthase TrpC/phosphoribosylanthranilate isomerase TrpF [Thalassotalea maritima]|uniref:bifunctional indole-3-glycerol-phosphate synthase TrpC/phosphoribosylanthranilate isomerase TrpF n=1 Tax=Thalassotalea maritima TaxID=3242416 RepID=UPI003526F2D5